MKSRYRTIWLVFAAIFIGMSLFHFYWAFQNMPEFVPPTRPLEKMGSVRILGMDVDQPLKEFANSFNNYVRSQNQSSRYQNLLSGIGYIVAFLTALASFWSSRSGEQNKQIANPHDDNNDNPEEQEELVTKAQDGQEQSALDQQKSDASNANQNPSNVISG
jgi:hypothetical protein